MNPCPCGYLTDPAHDCTCTPYQVQKYMAKISGPLLDRIDIHVEVPAVNYKDLAAESDGEISEKIRERVFLARKRQNLRFEKEKSIFANAHMQSREIRKYCSIDTQGQLMLKNAISKLGLSARAFDRILKVSRTIADLDQTGQIKPEHLAEAIQYRSLDRQLWLY